MEKMVLDKHFSKRKKDYIFYILIIKGGKVGHAHLLI